MWFRAREPQSATERNRNLDSARCMEHRRCNRPGLVYHVLNRAHGRRRIFRREGDYAAFEGTLAEALGKFPGVRLLAYCLMPHHGSTAFGSEARFD